MTREPIEVTRQDRIYCLKASSDYHSEVCEECRFYPNCDHMTQDDITELTIKDLEALEQQPCEDCISREKVLSEIETVCFSKEWIEFRLDNGSNGERDYIINYIKELPPVQPELFINKPCVSEQACHEDKMKVLEKIKAEIEQNAYPIVHGVNSHELGMTLYGILQVIDKYMEEGE